MLGATRALMLSLLVGVFATQAGAQQTPSSYSGSVSAGDGSTIPGPVSVYAHCLPSGCAPDWYLYGGPPGGITVNGPNNIGPGNTALFQNYAMHGFYFTSALGSTITCTEEMSAPFNTTCSGSFDLNLYAKEGAVEGTVTLNPAPASGDLSNLTVAYRAVGVGSWQYLFTNASGHYEKRSQTEPGRSNNWGLALYSGGGGASGPVTSMYDLAAGSQLETVGITSSQLTKQDFEIQAPYCKDPELRCARNQPPTAVGNPVDTITGNVYFDHQDSLLPGLPFARSYNSRHAYRSLSGVFGKGWSFGYESRLFFPDTNVVELIGANGVPIYYQDGNSDLTYEAVLPATETSTLVKGANGYTRNFREGGSESYDLQGRFLSSVDLAGRTTTLTRDAANQVVKVTAPSGRSLDLVYDGNGRVTTLVSEGLELAAYEYEGTTGAVARVTYADGSGYTYSYDSVGQIVQVADLSGRVVEVHAYDSSGRGITSELADGRQKYSLSYDTDTHRTTVTDALGNQTVYTWNSVKTFRVLTKMEGPCAGCGGGGGTNERWSYDTVGRMLTHTDSLDRITSYEYDTIGELVAVVDPLNRRTTYVRDSKARITSTTAPGSVVTSATYGNAGPLTLTDAMNRTTTMTYTAGGEVQTVTDPRGKVTTMAYFPNRDLQTVTDPLIHVTTFGYDTNGQRILVRDALSHDTTTTYDGRGRVTRITSHDGTHTDFTYDRGGRRVSVTDPLARTTQYTYDRYGWLAAVVDPMGQATRYGYDLMGRLSSLTDANGNTTAFQYDAYGRVTQVTYPGGAYETFTYDLGGQLATRVDRKSVTTTYSYDGLGRLTGKTYSDGTTPGVTYTYDTMGRLATAANGTDTLTWSYDLAGQLLNEQSTKNASTVAYTYDQGSNRLTLSLNGTLFVSYDYDDATRLTTITKGASVFGFGYDDANRRTSMSYPNGITTNYSYDTLNRLTNLQAVLNGTTTTTNFGYTYDAAGNRTSKQQLDYTEGYSYDPLYRLTGVERTGPLIGHWHYGYDPVGNRTSSQLDNAITTAAYNEKNQLLSSLGGGPLRVRGVLDEPGTVKVNGQPASMLAGNTFEATIAATPGTNSFNVEATDASGNVNAKSFQVEVSGAGASYTYDPNGNLIQKIEGADTWAYEWNAENQLTRVTKNAVEQARFKYDPLGRRVEKVAGGVTTSWTYDGRAILREQLGASLRQYVHGPGIDQPMAVEEAGATSFFHADAISSLTKTTTMVGAVTASYRHDAFGVLEAGPTAGGFGFTGREWDPEVQLHYYRARYYSAKDGRFVSADPQGYKDGPNLYAYVRGNPAKFIDPLGLAACCDCPSQEWDLHGGLTFSTSFLMGFSGGFGMMQCKDRPIIQRPVIIRCTSFGLQLGAGVSFDLQVGGPPSLTGVCHLNPFEPPRLKGWIGSGGPFTFSTDTEGLTKNFSLGLNPGAGFAYQECFIFPN